jgi:hypothetical protein
MRSDLRLDWLPHQAALFSVGAWHYSGVLPSGKSVRVGAWERDKFFGAIIFSRGNTPFIGAPFGLPQDQIAELTRVALGPHEAPSSRVVTIAVRMLRRLCPGLRMLVSYADPQHGHTGTLYQAMNWLFLGPTRPESLIRLRGRLRHPRTVGAKYGTRDVRWLREHVDPEVQRITQPPKFKYALAFDDDMRRRIAPMAKPYPKRPKDQAPTFPVGLGGETPTRPLHLNGSADV